MRSNRMFSVSTAAHAGMSLIELALVMVIVSLALVPMVKMIGGPSSEGGNAALVAGTKNKEAILANTMVNKVLAGDYSSLNCVGGNPVTLNNYDALFPTNGNPKTFAQCQEGSGNTPLYYQWEVMRMTASNNDKELPDNNRYYQATLNVLEKVGNRYDSIFTMPVNFFRNEGSIDQKSESTGVMIALDRSGSMAWSDDSWNLPNLDGMSSPFLFYRYKNYPTGTGHGWGFQFPNNPPAKHVLDKWDNSQLDLVYAKDIQAYGLQKGEDSDPSTANNEAYPFSQVHSSVQNKALWGEGLLGSGDCASTNSAKWNIGSANFDKNLAYVFHKDVREDNTISWINWNTGQWTSERFRNLEISLCGQKSTVNTWSNLINTKMSRFEAARTAALSLLLKLEEKKTVAQSIELGFFPWGSYAAVQGSSENHEVPLEKLTTINNQEVFENMREKLLWVNRYDPASRTNGDGIQLEGGTNIHGGLDAARQKLLAKNFDRRIIVLLTDGSPDPATGQNSKSGLRNYAKNSLGCGVSNPKQRITLFTVGLIAADDALMDDMATSTPSGQHFPAKDIASLNPIFDTIAYQIQKLALLSTASRYGLQISQDDECP